MEVKRVGRGEAPNTADRVYIDRQTDGLYSWIGSVAVADDHVFGNSPCEFRSIEEAEADAKAWAEGQGANFLFIEGPTA